ncbi:recombination mediator RecR [Neisseria cinerea]|uniref:recombination mediator RecR n=1 Tax=Neisseria cinerea TaxID=483 RepID=UPI002B1DC642|nr:recombination mediator RecR [Neisseria cinerea]
MNPKKQDAFQRLIGALKVLPNVGPKSAQRIAYHLLQHKRKEAEELVDALQTALRQVDHCSMCNTFCEDGLCSICADPSRDVRKLMIVHMPADVSNMEAANCHDGLYFVLMGQINTALGMDVSAIALDKLAERLKKEEIEEIIIATAFTAEGNATAFVLSEFFKNLPYKISRLSQGIPLGGELEYVDAGTLAQAVYERRLIKEGEL